MELEPIQQKIFEVRGCRVMLDFHLAELYDVETKHLKEAVRRNIRRFPPDFMFELTENEYNLLVDSLRSQFATSNKSTRGGLRYMPFAFTEHGVTMLSAVLNSDRAIEVNLRVIRAFVAAKQLALEYNELRNRMELLEFEVKDINNVLEYLMSTPKPALPERRPIGFVQGIHTDGTN